jgi:hypothetical protein
MSVAIIPIVPLHTVVLPAVPDVAPVVYHQIVSVGAVFASVPVMIVIMVPVVDSNLDHLRFGLDYCPRRPDSEPR